MTDLHRYVEDGNLKSVIEILKSGKSTAAVNTPNEDRIFPLHVAAKMGNENMTQLLLTYNAKVGCLDNNGLTPLHYAARAGHKESVLALLKQHAQVNSQTQDFWTPLHYATYFRRTEIVRILCEHKANPSETDLKGQTALHMACAAGYKDIVEILLSYDARFDVKDNTVEQQTAIELLQIKRPAVTTAYSESTNYEALSKDMRKLLYNSEYSDITFIFDSPTVEKVPAHRALLKARAPALLVGQNDSNQEKARNQTRRLPGMSCSAFRLMLEWIYTATIEIDEVDLDVAIELYNKSLDYQLPKLKTFVENVITSNIDESTAKTVLDVAISFKAEPIIAQCSMFIVENFNKILQYHKKAGQDEVSTKDELLEIVHHIDVVEGEIPTEMEPVVKIKEELMMEEPTAASASINSGGGLKVKIQRPAAPASRSRPRTSGVKKTETNTKVPVKPEPVAKGVGSNEVKKMQGKTLDLCKKLISQMMKDPQAPPFSEPVDPIALGIPQYNMIIKHPMDLGTIYKNLRNTKKRYKTLKDFAAAVRLVFDNARNFNQPGSPIYNNADNLSTMFEEKYTELKIKLGIPKQYDPAKPFQPEVPTQTSHIPMETLNTNPNQLPSTPASRDVQLQRRSARKSYVTDAEKLALHNTLANLSEWAMAKILEIIAPNSTLDGSGEMEIDLSSLPVATFRKLQKFVTENVSMGGENAANADGDSEEDYDNDPDYH